MKLFEVEDLYLVGSGVEVVRHQVQDGLFGDFSQSVNDTLVAAGDEVDEDEAWSLLLRYLKRLRFVLSSTPLWLAHPTRHCVGTLAQREQLIAEAELTRPTAIEALRTAFAYADLMHDTGTSELRSAAGELAADLGPQVSLGFVIKSPQYLECARRSLLGEFQQLGIGRGSATVLAPSGLRTSAAFDTLLVFGPTMWYPEHLLGTPRARNIHVLSHAWIKDREPQPLRFNGPGARDVRPRRRDRHVDRAGRPGASRPVAVEASSLLPTVDVRRLREMSVADDRGSISETEEARAYVLEGGKGVFLSAGDGSSRFTIDVNERTVRPTPVSRVEEGTFLVLRTEGSGDYVRTMADLTLGERSARLRAFQEAWKRPLREMIRRCGSLNRAAAVLDGLQVPQATPGNLARWASSENICTQRPETFRSLMEALETNLDVDAIWRQMLELRGAHHVAGTTIKRQLLDVVRNADLTPLVATGVMEFSLADDIDAGSLTAFRVNEVGTEVWNVEPHQLGRPFDLEA